MELTKPLGDYVEDFRVAHPEFSDFTDEQIGVALSYSFLFIGLRFGDYEDDRGLAKTALFLHVCHTAFTNKDAVESATAGILPGALRGVDSIEVGDVRLTNGTQIYLEAKPWNDELQSTLYGVQFLRLQRLVGIGPIIT